MKKLSLITVFFLTVSIFGQSPWTKKKGKAYVQLSFTTVANYNKLFGNPEKIIHRKITDNTIQAYAEYGLNDKTTIIANVPLKLLKSGAAAVAAPLITENTKTSLGNIQIGVKHNFYNKKWLLTGQLTIEANTSSLNAVSGLRTGYRAWSFTPLFIAGRGFNNWYLQVFTGFDVRSNNYSSNYKLGGEIGYKTIDWLWVAGFLDGVASLGNGDLTGGLETGLYVNNQGYAAFGLKLIGEFNDNFGANIGFGGALAGNNVAKAPALSFGLYHKF